MGFGSAVLAQDNVPLILNPRGVGISTWYEGDANIDALAACATESLTAPPVPAPVGQWIAMKTFYRPPDL